MLSLLFATAIAPSQVKISNWRAEDRASLRASHYRPRKIWSIKAPDDWWIESSQGYPLLLERPAGQQAETWRVLSPTTGQTLIRIEHCKEVKVSEGYVLAVIWDSAYVTTEIQGWDLRSRKLAWSVKTDKFATLGGVLKGSLYYSDAQGTYRTAVPSGDVLQKIDLGSVGLLVTPNRVYLDLVHWCHGLLPTDLNRGWKDYLDASPALEYDGVMYGIGATRYNITAVQTDGKVLSFKGPAWFSFWHDIPIITKSRIVLGGVAYRYPSPGHMGEYLFGFDRKSMKLAWKKPMWANNTTGYSDKVVVYAGRRTGQADATYEYPLEIRSVQTGSLLWRENRRVAGSEPRPHLIVGLGSKFLIQRDGKITAYW